MKKYWKDKWLAALRSGKYEQTIEFLCIIYNDNNNDNDNSKGDNSDSCTNEKRLYCCLGVLTELYLKEHNNLERKIAQKTSFLSDISELLVKVVTYYSSRYKSFDFEGLPEEVMEEVGIDEQYGPHVITEKEEQLSLAQLNDMGWTFEKIADIIEKQIPGE